MIAFATLIISHCVKKLLLKDTFLKKFISDEKFNTQEFNFPYFTRGIAEKNETTDTTSNQFYEEMQFNRVIKQILLHNF